MTTAQTVQLLDANNNNISPAVCIDSIYYEGTVGSYPYRFALREKFVVGGGLRNETTQLVNGKLLLPYIFANQLPGNESVWNLSTGYIDITSDVCTFIDNECKTTYETIDDVSNYCLWRNGSRSLTGVLNIGDKLNLSTSGLSDKDNKSSLKLDGSNASLTSKNKVSLDSTNVVEIGSHTKKIDIGKTDTNLVDVSIYGTNMSIHSQNTLDIVSYQKNIHINPYNDSSTCAKNVYIDTSTKGDGSIYLKTKHLLLNDFEFVIPDSSTRSGSIISLDTPNRKINWKPLGGLEVSNYYVNGQIDTSSFFFDANIEDNIILGTCISFEGDDTAKAVLGSKDLPNINIKSVGGQTLSGLGDISFNKIVTEDKSYSLIGNSSIYIVSTSTFENFKPTVTKKGSAATNNEHLNVCLWSESQDGIITIKYAPQVFVENGNVQAKAFIMSSDCNLKTDVREDCFEKEMPSLHGFKWKDSSIQSYGFIAQELEEAGFEHLVTEHNGIKGVDYMAALSYKVAQLEQENEMLWNAIHDLQQKLNNK